MNNLSFRYILPERFMVNKLDLVQGDLDPTYIHRSSVLLLFARKNAPSRPRCSSTLTT